MKIVNCFFLVFFVISLMNAQKSTTPANSNLNFSTNNSNILIYSENLLTYDRAQALLQTYEDQNKAADIKGVESWFAANLRRFGVTPNQIKQIFVFENKKFTECTNCNKNCKGQCAQDTGSACICVSHLDSKLKLTATDNPHLLVFLSHVPMEEKAALELVTQTITIHRPSTKKN